MLNDEVFLDENGQLIEDLGAFGFEWLAGNLTEGDGTDIAKPEQSCTVSTPLSSQSFNIICNFLAGTLEDRCREDTALNEKVSEMFGPGLQFPTIEEGSGPSNDSPPPPVMDRSNFLSQFFLASQAVIFANYVEVSGYKICVFSNDNIIACIRYRTGIIKAQEALAFTACSFLFRQCKKDYVRQNFLASELM